MKIRTIAAIILASLLLASCSKNNDAAKISETETKASLQFTEEISEKETKEESKTTADANETAEKLPDTEKQKNCEHKNIEFRKTKDATCTADGKGEYYCIDCGKITVAGEIKAKGHNFSYMNNETSHYSHCSVCGYSAKSELHKFNAEKVCEICGYGCKHQYLGGVCIFCGQKTDAPQAGNELPRVPLK